jgi:HD-like signal output (HDOD) protein
MESQVEEAFIAGLLHNIGQIAFYLHDPAAYEALAAEVVQGGKRFSELESVAYGTTHKEIGSEVLSMWNFPDLYSDCAKEHGNSNITSSHKKIVLIVSVGAFIAGNWTYFPDSPKPYALLDRTLLHLGMDVPGIDAYQAGYQGRLENDKFYKECQNLIMG